MITTVLIVEDEGLIALDMKQKLEQAGYTVPEIADNAEDALLCVEKHRPSLVMMDIRIIGPMDGIETADEIRQRFHIPVIFVTAHADRETLERARITEPFGYIVKPFQSINFRAQIEMALWKHKMEQKLRVSEKWFSVTFQSMADALIATDSEGNIAFMNQPAVHLTGWDCDEAQGQPLSEVFRVCEEITGLPVFPPYHEILNGREPEAGARIYKLLRRDGSPVLVEADISANRDQGVMFGVVAVFRDVTARRIAERQERQLQRMSALSLMATGLGRELTDSQNKMDASLKQLIEQTRGATQRLLWDVFERSAHQQSVVQQLITLGKADAGQSTVVDLNDVLAGMMEKLRKALGVRRPLTLNIQPGILLIRADPRNLRQNILRLLADVRQATPDGGPVTISTMSAFEDGSQTVQMGIRDTRKTFKADASERIFDPYYQSQPGNANPGFSLALVYQFVALSGGSIKAETLSEGGSTYLLNFPLAGSLETSQAAAQSNSASDRSPRGLHTPSEREFASA